MSNFEQKDQSGILFKNEKKTTDNQPDYQGTCMVNGASMDMSAWLKTGKSGKKFMSFSFKPPYKKDASRERPERQAPQDVDEDIPF